MELNKCSRCGCFYSTHNNVCPNCEPKDANEIAKLRTILQEKDCPNSLEGLSFSTGISIKNLNRFFEQEEFSKIQLKFSNKNEGNIGIQL